MAAIEWWAGQKVTVECRVATHEEVAEAKRKLEEDVWHPGPQPEDPNGEAKFIRMILSQGKNEHISAFATRLETAINSIQ